MPSVSLSRWVDNTAASDVVDDHRVDWIRCAPFVALHLLCLAAFWLPDTNAIRA